MSVPGAPDVRRRGHVDADPEVVGPAVDEAAGHDVAGLLDAAAGERLVFDRAVAGHQLVQQHLRGVRLERHHGLAGDTSLQPDLDADELPVGERLPEVAGGHQGHVRHVDVDVRPGELAK